MSSPIKEIALSNFKSFYDENTINLNGKHLLLYGENGSGKSSIYWALYTLLQSATKTNSQIGKYFTPNNNEHLINHHFLKEHSSFAIDSEGQITDPQTIGNNAFVEVALQDNTSMVIDSSGLNILRSSDSEILNNFNRYSDFIAHRLLINFYNFRNSKEINLWEVFVRDIFPFLLTNLGSGNETLGQILKEIESTKPFYGFSGSNFSIRTRRSNERRNYEARIALLNQNIIDWIAEINRLVNDFYNTHFRENGDVELRIELEYSNELTFGDIVQKHNYNNRLYQTHSKKHIDLNEPLIKLKVWHKDNNNNWIAVHRPQTYFNEAKLTQIALSVRFSLLDDSIRPPFPGQFLALDDLLISLDMSNRDKVLDIILKEFAPKYKIYLFTHERSFFNLIKRRIEYQYDKDNWVFSEAYMQNKKVSKSDGTTVDLPTTNIYTSNTFLSQAIFHQNNFPPDYPASANYLRKEIEDILTNYLPKEVLKNPDGTTKIKLNDFINASIKFYDTLGLDTTLLNKVNEFVPVMLNPLSHKDLSSEVYKVEIDKIIKLAKSLKTEIKNHMSNVRKVEAREGKLILSYDVNATTLNEYVIQLEEDLFVYLNNDGTYNLSITPVNKKCICYEIVSGTKGAEHQIELTATQKTDIKDLYESNCQREGIPVQPNLIPLLRTNGNNRLLNDIILDAFTN